jgi:2-polyprenyl-6-methoxyphenol hydroxylase-like FAD-dependent oxidoreductase
MAIQEFSTQCCIVGGGPCGLMLGLLLARAGIDVMVVEKHDDFLHDFRGDIIHPSTMEVMFELGLLDEFLKLPHKKEAVVTDHFGDQEFALADFRHLPTRAKFLAMMPQWDFLNFLAQQGRNYPSFQLRMRAEAVEVLEEAGRVTGIRCNTPDGPIDVRAELTMGCDGRHSIVRTRAGLKVVELGAPIDALWFRLSKGGNDPDKSMARLDGGRGIVLMDRGDYWQCALLILKGSLEEMRRNGLPVLRDSVVQLMPTFANRVEELADWEQINLLSATVNRLERWYRPGLLCIGDAAHAMSPIGGVGVNLAVQDAVAAANILWQPLANRTLREHDLRRVQRRREFPARAMQRIQVILHEKVINQALRAKQQPEPPLPVRLLARFPLLRRIPGRIVGMGLRPEHVKTPDVGAAGGHAAPFDKPSTARIGHGDLSPRRMK